MTSGERGPRDGLVLLFDFFIRYSISICWVGRLFAANREDSGCDRTLREGMERAKGSEPSYAPGKLESNVPDQELSCKTDSIKPYTHQLVTLQKQTFHVLSRRRYFNGETASRSAPHRTASSA